MKPSFTGKVFWSPVVRTVIVPAERAEIERPSVLAMVRSEYPFRFRILISCRSMFESCGDPDVLVGSFFHFSIIPSDRIQTCFHALYQKPARHRSFAVIARHAIAMARRSDPGYTLPMSGKMPCVYILANKKNGTLYVGVTSNLPRRIMEHKQGVFEGFTKKYNVHTLVYAEQAATMPAAIEREKQIKGGSRKKKMVLIEKNNPLWRDLVELY